MSSSAPQNDSIRDLLLDAVRQGPISNVGSRFRAFALPGLEDYVLRIRTGLYDPYGPDKASKLKARLLNTSSLVPVSQLVRGLHVGQPLMQLDTDGEITLQLRQRGVSLEDTLEQYRQSYESTGQALARATIATVKDIVELPQKNGDVNPFLSVFEQAYAMQRTGVEADIMVPNMLLDADTHRLTLVDQVGHEPIAKRQPQTKEQIEKSLNAQLQNILANYIVTPPPELHEEYEALYLQLRDMLFAARNEVYAHPPAPDRVAFETVESTHGIGLSQSVTALRHALGSLRTIALTSPGRG